MAHGLSYWFPTVWKQGLADLKLLPECVRVIPGTAPLSFPPTSTNFCVYKCAGAPTI